LWRCSVCASNMSGSEYQVGKRLAEDQQQQNKHRSDASQSAEDSHVLVAHVQFVLGDLVHDSSFSAISRK
jgi:hypothetical protein